MALAQGASVLSEIMWLRARKILALLSDRFYLRAYLRHGVAPAIEHTSVLRSLSFDFVADVGANRGQFSLLCRRLRPGAKIMGFEPLEEPGSIYRALFAGDRAVRLHLCALGQQRGTIEMNISAQDDSSSLLQISSVQTDNFPGTGRVETRPVQIGPLSDFISHADLCARNLLKIDVQGYELEVLKSAEPLLAEFDWVYVECSFVPLYEGQALADEIVSYLTERGYALQGQFNPSHGRDSNILLQADLLFARGRA